MISATMLKRSHLFSCPSPEKEHWLRPGWLRHTLGSRGLLTLQHQSSSRESQVIKVTDESAGGYKAALSQNTLPF